MFLCCDHTTKLRTMVSWICALVLKQAPNHVQKTLPWPVQFRWNSSGARCSLRFPDTNATPWACTASQLEASVPFSRSACSRWVTEVIDLRHSRGGCQPRLLLETLQQSGTQGLGPPAYVGSELQQSQILRKSLWKLLGGTCSKCARAM